MSKNKRPEDLPGFKKAELKNCAGCGKGPVNDKNRLPMFYRINLETIGLDTKGIQETHGLEQFFGGGQAGAALANVMGRNPDIAKIVDTKNFIVCFACATKFPVLFLADDKDDVY